MHTETFEQIALQDDLVENSDLMKEGQLVEMMFLADEERGTHLRTASFCRNGGYVYRAGRKRRYGFFQRLEAATIETGAELWSPSSSTKEKSLK